MNPHLNPLVDRVDMELMQFSDSLTGHFHEIRAQLDYEEIKLKDFTRRLRRVVFHGTSCKRAKIEQLTDAKETLNYTIVNPSFDTLKETLLSNIENELKTCENEPDLESVSEEEVNKSGERQLELYKSELIKTGKNISGTHKGLFGEEGTIAKFADAILPDILKAVISQCSGEIHQFSYSDNPSYQPSGYSEELKSKQKPESSPPSKEPPMQVEPEPENINYTEKGKPISSGGKKGKEIGELTTAKGVTFHETEDFQMRFYVADSGRVQIWNEIEGKQNEFNYDKQIIVHDEMKKPWGIAVQNTYIFVTDPGCHRVFRFMQNNYKQCKVYGGEKGDGGKQFNCPKGICIDCENNVYVADSDNKRVLVFNLHFIKSFGSVGTPDQFTEPKDVATTQDTIVVLDNGDKCVHFFQRNPDRNYIRSCITQGESCDVKSPSFFSLDRLKNIIISDLRNNRIRIFDEDGHFQHEFGTKGDEPGQFKSMAGVAVSNTSSIIVVSGNQNHGYQIF